MNSIISNFNQAAFRNDLGALWENFLISERKKYLLFNKLSTQSYFWRTNQQQEIDYIEEFAGNISAYEFKWNPGTRKKITQTFVKNYSVSSSAVVTPDNFESFIQ